MKRLVLVDGYNIIKRDPILSGLERRSLQTAREALFARLLSSYNLRACDVIVVFDGQGPAETTDRWGNLKIIYSMSGQTADTVIARLATLARDPSQVVALSDDREIRQAVTQSGGVAAGSADRKQPRAADKRDGDDEEDRSKEKKGNPRRAKKRDRQPQDKFRW